VQCATIAAQEIDRMRTKPFDHLAPNYYLLDFVDADGLIAIPVTLLDTRWMLEFREDLKTGEACRVEYDDSAVSGQIAFEVIKRILCPIRGRAPHKLSVL
jgi:hypothetical protein